MFQSHIISLQPPYNIIYSHGFLGRHIATMVVVEDDWSEADQNAIMGDDGKIRIMKKPKLHMRSLPIVSYGAQRRPWQGYEKVPLPFSSPSDGTVWDNIELSECKILCQEDAKTIPWDWFAEVVNQHCNVAKNGQPQLRIWEIYNQLLALGLDVNLPEKLTNVYPIPFDENSSTPLRPIFAKINMMGMAEPYFPFFLSNQKIYDSMTDEEKINRLASDIFNQAQQYISFFLHKGRRISFEYISISNRLKPLADRLNSFNKSQERK